MKIIKILAQRETEHTKIALERIFFAFSDRLYFLADFFLFRRFRNQTISKRTKKNFFCIVSTPKADHIEIERITFVFTTEIVNYYFIFFRYFFAFGVFFLSFWLCVYSLNFRIQSRVDNTRIHTYRTETNQTIEKK